MMIEKVMIQLGAKSPKIAGGLGGAAAPPMMMIEKVMIQSGAKSLKNSGGVGGGGSPPMMIEQLGAKNIQSSGRMMIEK